MTGQVDIARSTKQEQSAARTQKTEEQRTRHEEPLKPTQSSTQETRAVPATAERSAGQSKRKQTSKQPTTPSQASNRRHHRRASFSHICFPFAFIFYLVWSLLLHDSHTRHTQNLRRFLLSPTGPRPSRRRCRRLGVRMQGLNARMERPRLFVFAFVPFIR